MDYIKKISDTIYEGKPKYTERMVTEAIAHGCTADEILNLSFIPTMRDIGEQFKTDEIYIAKILSAARSMKYGLAALRPYMDSADSKKPRHEKIILGTVSGDLHDLGKNLVGLMFECAGFEVIDLGIDVSEKKFLQSVKEHPDAVVVCISSLLTSTMGEMKHIVQSLNRLEQRKNFHIMVGGAPITQEFADEIGADAYTEHAYECAELAKTYVV